MKIMKKMFAQHGLLVLLLALGVAAISPRLAAAVSVTQAIISDCVDSDDQIVCENKMDLSLEVSYGAGATLQTQYIQRVTRAGGVVITLEDPLQIRITESEPAWSYPLRYLHTVDYAPREELIKVPNISPGIAACVDGSDSAAPTCGWQMDGSGNRIADSQGFCGNRNLLTLKINSDPQGWWRGEKELGQSTLASSFSIAHCLRESGVSYRGYEIDPPRRDYRIDLSIWKSTTQISAFTLTPDAPIYQDRSGDYPVKAELVGEDRPAAAPPDLSGYILYAPSAAAAGSQEWKDNLLLAPRGMVTTAGNECDKIGASYAAFRGEAPDAAKSAAGACLGNQLKQLQASDLARLAANPAAETDYLLRGKRLFKDGLAGMTGPVLRVASPELIPARVGVEMNEATVGVITAESPGVIVSATAADHAAPTREGALLVTIKNSGRLAADYLVTVSDCQPGIRGSIPAMARTLGPNGQALLTFALATESGLTGSHSCRVVLSAPGGRVYGEQTVSFTTNAVSEQTPSELLLRNNDTTVKP